MHERKIVNSLLDKFENPEKAETLFEKVKSRAIFSLLIEILEMLEPVAERRKAVSKEFKFWFSEDHVCFLYIRPAASHMTIVPAYMDMDSISSAAQRYGLSLELKPGSNPEDQFDAQIHVDEDWLDGINRAAFLRFFHSEIVDAIDWSKITTRQ